MAKVRWGIIGAGRIAHSFARDIQYVANAELIGVAARNGDSARSFSAEYGVPLSFEGYADLFSSPEIDAVYIATPHNLHLEQAVDAINHGKAVLCEKPLVVNPDQCRELTRYAQNRNVYLMEGMWTFFLPAVIQAKRWVAEGRIGKIRHIKADFGYPLPYDPKRREYDNRLAGGCLLEMGVYPVAFAQHFFGSEPDTLQVHSHIADNGVEDDVLVVAEHGDALATLATSFRCKLQNWAYIIGEAGYIAIPDFWRADSCSLYQLDKRIDHFEDERAGLGFNFEIEAVSSEILSGVKQSVLVPHDVSLSFQKTMQRVREQFVVADENVAVEL